MDGQFLRGVFDSLYNINNNNNHSKLNKNIGKELDYLDQFIFMRWQKETMSQYLLLERFKTFLQVYHWLPRSILEAPYTIERSKSNHGCLWRLYMWSRTHKYWNTVLSGNGDQDILEDQPSSVTNSGGEDTKHKGKVMSLHARFLGGGDTLYLVGEVGCASAGSGTNLPWVLHRPARHTRKWWQRAAKTKSTTRLITMMSKPNYIEVLLL